jgi:hypothetical protein
MSHNPTERSHKRDQGIMMREGDSWLQQHTSLREELWVDVFEGVFVDHSTRAFLEQEQCITMIKTTLHLLVWKCFFFAAAACVR